MEAFNGLYSADRNDNMAAVGNFNAPSAGGNLIEPTDDISAADETG